MTVIRDEEYYKYHIVNTDEISKYGMEKACILGNVQKFPTTKYEDLHEKFPYIEKNRFYLLIDELLKEGLVVKNG